MDNPPPAPTPLACRCGAVRGFVDLPSGPTQRLTCRCGDCQAFANWLRDDLLDDEGGTPIVQITPGALSLTHGREEVRAIRLTDTGMVRWYASCCRTPIGNTPPGGSPPFIGLVERFMPEPPAPAAQRSTGRLLLGGARIVLTAWWRNADHPLFPDGQPFTRPVVLASAD